MNQLKLIPEKNKLIVSYEDFCQETSGFLTKVKQQFDFEGAFKTKDLPKLKVQSKAISTKTYNQIEKARINILKLYPNLNLLNV